MPPWALLTPDHRFFTRRRMIGVAIAALLLALVAWINYPFLPNPVVLIFNRPSTDLSSNSAVGQWSMDGGALDQSRNIDGSTAPPVGQLSWSLTTGLPTLSRPVVSQGVIYLGSHFKFLALDATSGQTLWEREINGPVHASAAVAGDLVYVPLINRRVLALDRNTGDLRWEFSAGDSIIAAPVVAKGIVYIGSWDGKIYARDAATGAKIWTYQTSGRVSYPVALGDGVLVVSDDVGQTHTLNPRTGQNRLVYRTPRAATGASVTANALAYFPSDGALYAIDSQQKEIPWQFQFKQVWTQLWLWQTPGVPPPPSQQGERWQFSPLGNDSTILASPAMSQGVLYVGDLQGNFYAQDALTAQDHWKFSAQGRIFASPLVVGERVYFGTDAGILYALNRADGSLRWQIALGAPIKLPPAYAQGRIYLRTEEGNLHAVE